MNRREFLRNAALTGIAVSSPLVAGNSVWGAGRAGNPDLAVASGLPPGRITEAAVNALGGMKRFVSRGDVVVVKPNMAWDRAPEYAANTNPDVVAAVVRLCFEAGAKTVKVFDRSVNDPRRCYVRSGIAEKARLLGALTPYTDDRRFKEMNIRGDTLKKWALYSEVFEADKVINVPIAKHHSLAGLTLGMKNWMGIMGGTRRRIHRKLDDSLVDLARFVKPALTVLDAVRILTANGPRGGSLEDVQTMNTVIAGTDQVAVDAYGATLFGRTGDDVGYVRLGHDTDLGTKDLSSVWIKKVVI